MALIKCPECGKEISDKAAACIHCGCPLQPPVYQTEPQYTSEDSIIDNPVRMGQTQIIAVLALLAVSFLFPYIMWGFHISQPISFVISLLIYGAIVALAVIQPQKKELYVVALITISEIINFVVSHFLYSEPLYIVGLLTYIVLLSMLVVYWLSAIGLINNATIPMIITIAYTIFSVVLLFIANSYGRIMFSLQFVSVVSNVTFYFAGCIMVYDGMKHRQRKIPHATLAGGFYPHVQDAPSTGFAVLSFCFPIVGLVLFCVWHDILPQRAKSAGVGALIGFVISVILVVIMWGVILS